MEELRVIPDTGTAEQRPVRRPEWLKIQLRTNEHFRELKALMRGQTLHTVCEEARCPNIYECWSNRTATFMILG
ncbi:MAG: lipoyl synthase, partial [Alicyclobacillaceae bacterium]|nr:lipoyl synthase [Alicyclobacillaceae bacterium]